mmetsp:Transcript_9811/g.17626  ORF Transcript_9811/g.17626 Transcript_9811/m.17626 type:complete len:222 (-) Transcript_9811:443-1108(-)
MDHVLLSAAMDSAYAVPGNQLPRGRMWNFDVRIPSRTPSPYFSRQYDYAVTSGDLHPLRLPPFTASAELSQSESSTPRGHNDLPCPLDGKTARRLPAALNDIAKDFDEGVAQQSNGPTRQNTLESFPDTPSCMPCTSWADESQEEVQDVDSCLSLGSRGHPFTCAAACKYYPKKRGCKDGMNCDRCHLCTWTRTPPDALKSKVGMTAAKGKNEKKRGTRTW